MKTADYNMFKKKKKKAQNKTNQLRGINLDYIPAHIWRVQKYLHCHSKTRPHTRQRSEERQVKHQQDLAKMLSVYSVMHLHKICYTTAFLDDTSARSFP